MQTKTNAQPEPQFTAVDQLIHSLLSDRRIAKLLSKLNRKERQSRRWEDKTSILLAVSIVGIPLAAFLGWRSDRSQKARLGELVECVSMRVQEFFKEIPLHQRREMLPEVIVRVNKLLDPLVHNRGKRGGPDSEVPKQQMKQALEEVVPLHGSSEVQAVLDSGQIEAGQNTPSRQNRSISLNQLASAAKLGGEQGESPTEAAFHAVGSLKPETQGNPKGRRF